MDCLPWALVTVTEFDCPV